MSDTPNSDLYFMYVADPMCSWCWGFAPVLEKILETHKLTLRIVIGGLRPGAAAQTLDSSMQAYLKNHWQAVEQTSGQPFNYETLTRENWLYDSELPARAVVTMRQLNPDQELQVFKTLQKAFYQEAVDITQPDTYPALLDAFNVDESSFVEQMLSDDIKEQTYQDFGLARHLGIQGFPSLLLGKGNELSILCRGYQPFERLNPLVQNQINQIQHSEQ